MPPVASTTTLRRHDDQMLADFDKRLALIEQGNDLHAKANEARSAALQHAIDGLTVEVRNALQLISTATSDPSASPAGRQLMASDAELRKDVDDVSRASDGHEQFINEARGALRLAKFALGTSFLSVAGNVILGLIYLATGHHP